MRPQNSKDVERALRIRGEHEIANAVERVREKYQLVPLSKMEQFRKLNICNDAEIKAFKFLWFSLHVQENSDPAYVLEIN